MRNVKIMGVPLRSEGRISTGMPSTNLGLGVSPKLVKNEKK
jgi:hypothetical protein